MSTDTEKRKQGALKEMSLESGLLELFNRLGMPDKLLSQLENGYPQNSAYLNLSLSAAQGLLDKLASGDEEVISLLQKDSGLNEEQARLASETFKKYYEGQ